MFSLETFVAEIAILCAWTGLMEWRIRSMQTQLEDKIKDREELTKYKIEELKEGVDKLERKIDMLIKLNIKRRIDNVKPQGQ